MKTKADLLRAMNRMGACYPAALFVANHESDCAERIGLSCGDMTWKLYFLIRKLEKRSLGLFARRLGQKAADFYVGHGAHRRLLSSPHAYVVPSAHRNPAVINDCWRAWCRSKP